MLTIFGSAERRPRHRAAAQFGAVLWQISWLLTLCPPTTQVLFRFTVYGLALADLMASETLSVDITNPV
jgi:hypothetical protein